MRVIAANKILADFALILLLLKGGNSSIEWCFNSQAGLETSSFFCTTVRDILVLKVCAHILETNCRYSFRDILEII